MLKEIWWKIRKNKRKFLLWISVFLNILEDIISLQNI